MAQLSIPTGWVERETGKVGAKPKDYPALVARLAKMKPGEGIWLPGETDDAAKSKGWKSIQSANNAAKKLRALADKANVKLVIRDFTNPDDETVRLAVTIPMPPAN